MYSNMYELQTADLYLNKNSDTMKNNKNIINSVFLHVIMFRITIKKQNIISKFRKISSINFQDFILITFDNPI